MKLTIGSENVAKFLKKLGIDTKPEYVAGTISVPNFKGSTAVHSDNLRYTNENEKFKIEIFHMKSLMLEMEKY